MSRNVIVPVEDRLAVTDRRKFAALDAPMHTASQSIPYLVGLRHQIEREMEARVNNLEEELAPLLPESEVMERLATNYAIAIYFAEKVYFLQLTSTCVHFCLSNIIFM